MELEISRVCVKDSMDLNNKLPSSVLAECVVV